MKTVSVGTCVDCGAQTSGRGKRCLACSNRHNSAQARRKGGGWGRESGGWVRGNNWGRAPDTAEDGESPNPPTGEAAGLKSAECHNPYLAEWLAVNPGGRNWLSWTLEQLDAAVDSSRDARRRCIPGYGFAIPNEAALTVLAKHAPLLEIGPGGGYWCYLLRQRGVDIVALDTNAHDEHPRSSKESGWGILRRWTHIDYGDASESAMYPDRTLFLCWPPRRDSMAHDALRLYTGDACIYVGEPEDGCTGSDEFHALLNAEWNETERLEIPQWYGSYDYVAVYRRKVRQQ